MLCLQQVGVNRESEIPNLRAASAGRKAHDSGDGARRAANIDPPAF
jgi:hypothetical protein